MSFGDCLLWKAWKPQFSSQDNWACGNSGFGFFLKIRLTSSSCPTFFPELGIAREFRKKLPCKGYGMFWKRDIVKAFWGDITGLDS